MSRIGEKIKVEREHKGLSPKQLGKKCGVSESYILDIESGRRIINEKLLQQISKIIGKDIEDNIIQEPSVEEISTEKVKPKHVEKPKERIEINPVGQWSEALSGIIKKVPIFDMQMKNIMGYRNFPIIDKKVEGYNPEKLAYIKVSNDGLKGMRIQKGDLILIYLNHELINNSIALVDHGGILKLRKVKRLSGTNVELLELDQEVKSTKVELKDIKIIGRALRLEVDLKG